jgi:hypothetical protein
MVMSEEALAEALAWPLAPEAAAALAPEGSAQVPRLPEPPQAETQQPNMVTQSRDDSPARAGRVRNGWRPVVEKRTAQP